MGSIFLLIFLTRSAFSQTPVWIPNQALHSAQRGPRESARQAYQRYLARLSTRGTSQIPSDTPLNLAKPLSQLDLGAIPSYKNPAVATMAFFRARDARFILDQNHHLVRRSSWLYPDDGCFARAALIVKNLTQWRFPAPAKLFVFGNLSLKTPYAIEGSVTWWYHVVPVIRLGQQVFVFDPTVNPTQPLPLSEWLPKITSEVNAVQLSVCHPTTYSPSSSCLSPGNDNDQALTDETNFLSLEWARLLDLGHDPLKDLGDFPPWAN